MEASLRHLLLDPEYWRPRLAELKAAPRHLLVFPRPDLGRPGCDVEELRLKAHDGTALLALLGRPGFQIQGECLRVRLTSCLETQPLDWAAIEDGTPEVLFQRPDARRLEDRVLDVVRVARAASQMVQVECAQLEFEARPQAGDSCLPDEVTIARLFQNKGWLTDPGGCETG